LYAHLTH